MDVPIAISVQGVAESAAQWRDLARRADAAGLATLYVPDHPGSCPAPFVALAAAAAVTERIALGTCVVNAGLWEPVTLASEVATLDVVSEGRALLGLGAGHTPSEWEAVGRAIPPAGARVDRLEEVVATTTGLLSGEVAGLDAPRPVQERVPLMVGGGGPRVLALAARTADVVGVTGLGRTQADGHRHDVAWSRDEVDASFTALHDAAVAAGRSPSIEALVQHVEVTDDRLAAAEAFAARVDMPDPTGLLDVPYVWLGTVDEIADQLRVHRVRWGVDRYVVRPPVLDAAEAVLGRLRDL